MLNDVKGVYVLIISVSKYIRVKVGALGSLNFEKGVYAYIGSAQNNLEKRIKRHLKKSKRKFWHIDYLLENEFVDVGKALYKEAERSEECRLARKLSEMSIPVVDFGCSDCACVSHLFMRKDEGHSRSSWVF